MENKLKTQEKAEKQAVVSSSAFKDFQFLFDNYKLSDEEQNWCREFEMASGIEPIYTNDAVDKKSFIEMAKLNNQYIVDCADEVVSRSESVIWKLSYYNEVVFG